MSKPHLTAITRKRPSSPMRWLSEQGLLVGRMLDFGCGKGFDAKWFRMHRYDPFYAPRRFKDGFEPYFGYYDTITCNYVLNVVEDPSERDAILATIWNLLAPGGRAYITVRADRRNLRGWTSKGTWQGYIVLPLPMIKRTANYEMYCLEK